MKCTNCQQASNWARTESNWSPVHPGEVAAPQIYECDRCGNRQLNR